MNGGFVWAIAFLAANDRPERASVPVSFRRRDQRNRSERNVVDAAEVDLVYDGDDHAGRRIFLSDDGDTLLIVRDQGLDVGANGTQVDGAAAKNDLSVASDLDDGRRRRVGRV